MDGRGDDPAPPDSWEMADLDASVGRLLVSAPSSKKSSASSLSAFSTAAEEQGMAEAAFGLAAGEGLGQVDQFLREALEKPRERLAVLRMEQDILKFIRDPTQQQLELQPLPTSYLRLAAHRLAQHYYLQSSAIPDVISLDGSGSRILLRKTSYVCRMPPFRLADIPVNLPQEDNNVTPKVAIKQRPQKNSLNSGLGNAHNSKGNSQKSVEERKEEYNRARARIFSSSSGSAVAKPDEVRLPDSLQDCSFVSAVSDEKSIVDGPANSLSRSYSDSSSGSSRSSKTKLEKEPVVSRQRSSNRVAIFRDREVDRKDPDYDRSYDRYMQRFDPGFGFSNGSYAMQPLYSPAVNYNTEFPILGAGHRGPIPMDHQPRPIPQHLHGTWSAASAPNAVNYGPPESMMGPPFNPSHVGAPPTSSVYLHSSQYSVPSHPGLSFVRPNEHVQHIAQSHQQQPEASFGLARPR